MITIRLPGWDDYHETHDPIVLESGGGILWIPKEMHKDRNPAISLTDTSPKTEDEFVEALIAAMATPVEDPLLTYPCGCPVVHAEYPEDPNVDHATS